MKVRTYLKQNPEIKEVWIMAGDSFCLCKTDNPDDMTLFGDRKIKVVEPPPEPGELISLHIL